MFLSRHPRRLPARGFADRPALRRGLLHLTGETLHRTHHRRDAGPRQVERHPLGAEGPHPADVRRHLGHGALKRGAAGALRRVREVEEVTRRKAERVAPAALSGEVAQRREALLDVIETERQRMPGVTELGAAAHGWPGHRAGRATDPDRRVRPLRGTGGERGAGEARVRALVLRNIAGPGRLDRAEIVVAQAPALPEWQAEVYELGLVPAHADAEDEAPARRLVDGGCRLGGHEGVPVGKHDDAGAEVDALRAPGEGREERKRVWPVAAIVLGGGGLGEDMIRDEDAVETQLLRARRQRLCLGDRELPDRKHDPIVHETLPPRAVRARGAFARPQVVSRSMWNSAGPSSRPTA